MICIMVLEVSFTCGKFSLATHLWLLSYKAVVTHWEGQEGFYFKTAFANAFSAVILALIILNSWTCNEIIKKLKLSIYIPYFEINQK